MARASVSRTMRLSQSCQITAVPDGATSSSDRETVIAALACSNPYPASIEAQERAGLGLTARALTIYTAVPEVAIQDDQRLVLNGIEYRIRAISPWPVQSAAFYELLVEAEG